MAFQTVDSNFFYNPAGKAALEHRFFPASAEYAARFMQGFAVCGAFLHMVAGHRETNDPATFDSSQKIESGEGHSKAAEFDS